MGPEHPLASLPGDGRQHDVRDTRHLRPCDLSRRDVAVHWHRVVVGQNISYRPVAMRGNVSDPEGQGPRRCLHARSLFLGLLPAFPGRGHSRPAALEPRAVARGIGRWKKSSFWKTPSKILLLTPSGSQKTLPPRGWSSSAFLAVGLCWPHSRAGLRRIPPFVAPTLNLLQRASRASRRLDYVARSLWAR